MSDFKIELTKYLREFGRYSKNMIEVINSPRRTKKDKEYFNQYRDVFYRYVDNHFRKLPLVMDRETLKGCIQDGELSHIELEGLRGIYTKTGYIYLTVIDKIDKKLVRVYLEPFSTKKKWKEQVDMFFDCLKNDFCYRR